MSTNETKKDKHLVKHLIIRLVLLFIPAILLFALSAILTDPYYALFSAFAALVSPSIGFIFIIIEAIVLHRKKKLDLRNINLIMICVFLTIYIIILINHP
ncbi:hypothetical protein EZ449_09755 [Pedobacter frigidisoli]|uniref:Uncharacterized protein n=1 Tax=Pedobacter frigidisoli TaxID=2530455 RepID=A0A4R0P4K1_9SPHI|nr:hypothetical protein [Pedobacter frigidisoli]TCD10617.1 hypothetical protein EZ449_09755 [Pedobacter frigidisoli]